MKILETTGMTFKAFAAISRRLTEQYNQSMGAQRVWTFEQFFNLMFDEYRSEYTNGRGVK